MNTNKGWKSVMWIGVSLAIAAGIIVTKNLHCLWFFFIPAILSIFGEY